MRSLPRWLGLWAFLILGSCGGGGNGTDAPPAVKPPPAPKVSAMPPPGSYLTYAMTVTISTDGDAKLFYDLEQTPDVAANKAYESQFSVLLQKSSRISVLVQDGGKTWGPYFFEYQISRPLPGSGGCTLAPLPKYWYRGIESLSVSVDYLLPVSISKLEVMVDGNSTPLILPDDSSHGTQVADLGILPEGVHELGCRVSSVGLPDITGSTVALGVDGQAPAAAWMDADGAFSRETWPGYFRLQASDALSGVGSVEVCDSAHIRCMPMLELGGGVYAYATALTLQTSSGGLLSARVMDIAGNLTTVGILGIDLSGFAEPAIPAVAPITMTTEAALNVPLFLGRGVSEVCDLTLTSCYDPSDVPLVNGWNDFLFRTPVRTEWESLGIYRNGVRALLPESAFPWLVYASEGTAPMMQASLVAVAMGVNDWQRSWFDIPHLFFVEDVNANGRWDQYDNLFTVASDSFSSAFIAVMAPLVVTPVQYQFGSQPATVTVSVTCPQDCGAPGRLYFERRSSLYAYPETHVDLGPALGSFALPATTTDGCLFFWDENDDGMVNGTEPRSSRCSYSISLTRQYGVLAWEELSPQLRHLKGVPFGGVVTRTLQYLSSSDAPLVSRAVLPFIDSSGDGLGKQAVGGFQEDGPILGVKARLVFRFGSQVTWVTLATGPAPSQPYLYQVGVTDETGALIAALVRAEQGGYTNIGVADGGGLSMGMPATWPSPSIFAFRDGYLSYAVVVTTSSVNLRLLSPSVTGLISGLVVDTYGALVSNATVSWSAPPYSAQTLSGPEGSYAIPASGGTGILSVSAPGKFVRVSRYELDVTRTTVVQAVVLPADDDLWPIGPHLGYSAVVTGADLLWSAYGDFYYAGQVSGAASLFVDWSQMRREVDTTGFLPASPGSYGTPLSAQSLPFLQSVNSRAVCGARSQSALAGLSVDSSCWSWIGGEDGRDYFLGRISPLGSFPPVLGLGKVFLYVSESGNLPPNQTLTLHEQLMGQTMQIELQSGSAVGHLPMGIYRVSTAGGAFLRNNLDQVAEFAVSDYFPPSISLIIPSAP